MAHVSEIYINDGKIADWPSKAGMHVRSVAALTTSYAVVMPENSARARFTFNNRATNGSNIFILINSLNGSTGDEYVLTPGGTFSRSVELGEGVWIGPIYAKGASGSEKLDAEEG